VISTVLFTIAAGAGAGLLGSVLGLGGGVFLVPLLNKVVALPFLTAAAVSLFSVVGTSTSVSMLTASRQLLNLRLAVVLLVASVLGAMTSARALEAGLVSNASAQRIFGVSAVLIAIVMLPARDRRNVIKRRHGVDRRPRRTVSRDRERRRLAPRPPRSRWPSRRRALPHHLTLTGVGGGILIVPALNSWCGIPLRARGDERVHDRRDRSSRRRRALRARAPDDLELVAAAVLGVLFGTRGGVWLGGRVPVKWLKIFWRRCWRWSGSVTWEPGDETR
jgi:uncharacterized membrane protein YfcA